MYRSRTSMYNPRHIHTIDLNIALFPCYLIFLRVTHRSTVIRLQKCEILCKIVILYTVSCYLSSAFWEEYSIFEYYFVFVFSSLCGDTGYDTTSKATQVRVSLAHKRHLPIEYSVRILLLKFEITRPCCSTSAKLEHTVTLTVSTSFSLFFTSLRRRNSLKT